MKASLIQGGNFFDLGWPAAIPFQIYELIVLFLFFDLSGLLPYSWKAPNRETNV